MAQSRVKTLAGKRDQLIRDAGIEEQKLQQVYDNLRQLGVSNPESLDADDLQRLAETTQAELESNMQSLTEALSKGESLLEDYSKSQQEQ